MLMIVLLCQLVGLGLTTAHPAMAFGDGVEQVDPIIVGLIIIAQPIDHLFAGVPDGGGHKIEKIFSLVVDPLERAVILQG